MFAVFALESTCNLVDKRVFWSVFAYIKTGVVTFGGSLLSGVVTFGFPLSLVIFRGSLLSGSRYFRNSTVLDSRGPFVKHRASGTTLKRPPP